MQIAPHVDIQQKAQRKKVCDQRRPSITEQRKRKAGYREKANGHANIKDYIERKRADDAQSDKETETIAGSICDVQSL